jgi:hypothetical protein
MFPNIFHFCLIRVFLQEGLTKLYASNELQTLHVSMCKYTIFGNQWSNQEVKRAKINLKIMICLTSPQRFFVKSSTSEYPSQPEVSQTTHLHVWRDFKYLTRPNKYFISIQFSRFPDLY